jgi:hypothetical protein
MKQRVLSLGLSLAKVRNLRKAGKALSTCAVLLLVVAMSLVHLDAATMQAGSSARGIEGTGYELTWWTVDGGGTVFNEGGDYALGGSIGQWDAGVLAHGIYVITGGFWQRSAVTGHFLYLPLAVKND